MFSKERSIKNEILAKVILILVLSISLLVSYNYIAGKRAALHNVSNSIKNLNSSVIYQASKSLLEIGELTHSASSFIGSSLLTNMDIGLIQHYMHSVMSKEELVSSLRLVSEHGSSVLIARITAKMLTKHPYIPRNAIYLVRVIEKSFDENKSECLYYDKNFVLIGKNNQLFGGESDDYRKYDWYKNTRKDVDYSISDLQILKNTNVPGVILTSSIKDKNGQHWGVFLIEMSVQELSSIINDLRPTEFTHSFIVNSKNQIVADSDMPETEDTSNDAKAISLADTLSDPVAKNGLEYAKNNNASGEMNSLDINNVNYIVSKDHFPNTLGIQWSIVSITPTSVLTSDLLSIQQNGLYIAFFTILISFIIIYFQAQKLSEPLSILSFEASKIKNLELGDSLFPQTNIVEIEKLTDTMQEMQQNLTNFSKFVPKGLVKQFIENKKELTLGGEAHELTLMFTDIADFTTASERLKPQELMMHLSDYFEELTKIILDNNGTVDKFIGDAVMAFWGAPNLNSNQTVDACRSALLSKQLLVNLNRYWTKVGKTPLNTRFGINYGTAIVGNVGNSERMNYTAIGDTVNLAARLESINKIYGTTIIISEAASKRLTVDYLVRPLDVVAVKGKTYGTKIFELVGLNNDEHLYPLKESQISFCAEFEKAFNLYLARDWSAAKAAFETLDKLNQKEFKYPDRTIPIYLERCQTFKDMKLPSDWDGVVRLKEK